MCTIPSPPAAQTHGARNRCSLMIIPFFPLDMPVARCTHSWQCLLADEAGRNPACLHLALPAVPTPIPFVSTKCGVCGSLTIKAGVGWLFRNPLLSCLEGRITSPRVNSNVIATRSKKNSGVPFLCELMGGGYLQCRGRPGSVATVPCFNLACMDRSDWKWCKKSTRGH